MKRDAQGGSIYSTQNQENEAGIDYVEYEQLKTGSPVTVVLSTMPRISNYNINEKLVINAKGTNNPNSNHTVKVVSVVGPMKYQCKFV